jgi:CRISPR-associated protein Cas2
MLVIVLENAPPRLKGYLSRLLLEVRAGVFLGDYSTRVRERLWEAVCKEIGAGNGVMAWNTSNDAGFDFETCGENRRVPVVLDGLKLCAFMPQAEASLAGRFFDKS